MNTETKTYKFTYVSENFSTICFIIKKRNKVKFPSWEVLTRIGAASVSVHVTYNQCNNNEQDQYSQNEGNKPKVCGCCFNNWIWF